MLPFDFRQALVNTEIGVVMALSLVVITGFVGQISVVQLSLAGVTGFVISRLAIDHGVPFPWAPLAAIAVAVVLGLVTAVSALRVRGVSLVIVTLAGAVAISQFYFNNTRDRRRGQRLARAQPRDLRAEPQPERGLPRAGREHPEPRLRLGRARRRRC